MRELNMNEVEQVSGAGFAEGAAIVGGTILAVALAPEIAIVSVAGIAALATETAGAWIMSN